jgi:hypothetical protein
VFPSVWKRRGLVSFREGEDHAEQSRIRELDVLDLRDEALLVISLAEGLKRLADSEELDARGEKDWASFHVAHATGKEDLLVNFIAGLALVELIQSDRAAFALLEEIREDESWNLSSEAGGRQS